MLAQLNIKDKKVNKSSLMQKIQNWLKKTKPLAVTAFLSVFVLYAKNVNGSFFHLENLLFSPAMAQTAECTPDAGRITALKNAASGFFKNIRLAEKPFNAGALSFNDENGKNLHLSDFKGKVLLVNLWATWCNPCRVEMPELSALKTKLGGNDFDVITINIDRGSEEKSRNFLKEIKADNFAFYRDNSMKIFQDVRREGLAVGLPITLLVDENSCLLASFNGAAPWGDDDSQALIKAAIATKAQ